MPAQSSPSSDVQRATAELMAIHDSGLAALLADDFVLLVELRSKVQKAREKKTHLIDLYCEHVQSHGCYASAPAVR
jgi:hypothetical protein